MWAIIVVATALSAAACNRPSAKPADALVASASSPSAGQIVPVAPTGDGRTSHAPVLPALGDTVVGASVHVTYTPATVIVDRATLERTLSEVSDDGSVYTFDAPAGGALDALRSGSVMLLQTYALRKVRTVSRDGGRLRVETSPAALTDAILDGSIKWQHDVRFAQRGALSTRGESSAGSSGTSVSMNPPAAQPQRKFLDRLGDLIAPPLYAASVGAMSATGTVGDYGYTLDYTPGDDRINTTIEVTKHVTAMDLKLTGTGYLQDFANGGDVEISGGSLTSADFTNTRLNGEVNFSWAARTAVGAEASGRSVVRIPAVFRVPLIIGGIPFSLGIKAAFSIEPSFTSKQATAEGRFKVTYNGSEGFKISGSDVTATGTIASEPEIGEGSTIFGMGVQGFTAAIQFPKIELGLGTIGTEAVGYVDIVTSAASITPGELGARHCQKHMIDVSGKAGAVFSAFGMSLGEVKAPLWDKTLDASVPAGVNCDP